MDLTPAEKKEQIVSWVKKFRKTESRVIVSDYCYDCFFSGNKVNKTLIVFPDEIEEMGILTINKSLAEVEIPDVIKLYKKVCR